MYRFWLDITHDEEYEIAESIESLKQERSFTRTIRDGIRLICDLRQGRVEVLLSLFPWIREHFVQESSPQFLPENDPLRLQIDQISKLLLERGAAPVDMPRRPQTQLPAPQDAEDLLEVTQAKNDANNNSTWNFMIASALQVYESCDPLPPEIIEYGLRTGRIPPGMVKQKPPKTDNKDNKKEKSATKNDAVQAKNDDKTASSDGNPKKMDVPDLPPPAFDDLDFALG
jgi:hypothetical protein